MAKVKKGEHCLNCDTKIEDANYCPNCGQINDQRRLTFSQLITESLANVLSFDGRFFKTFVGVISQPGQIAHNFTIGKRARYMNPVRFYFLSSLLMIFAIQYQNTNPVIFSQNADNENKGIVNIENEETKSHSLDSLILASQSNANSAGSFKKINYMLSYLELKPEATAEEVLSDLQISKGFFNEFLFTQAQKIYDFNNRTDNYDSFNKAFLNKLFWILFFYIPVLGLLLKLIYWRRKINYPDHLFFAFYQQAFFFQLFFIYVLFNLSSLFFGLFLLIYGFHLLLAMKHFYAQSWRKTIFKFFLSNILATVSFMLFFVAAAMVVFITL